MPDRILTPCIFTIFGGTGDLTRRKLIPALYNMSVDGVLPEELAVVCVGRRPYSTCEYRDILLESVTKHSRYPVRTDKWEWLRERIHYYRMDLPESEGYLSLKAWLEELDEKAGTRGNRLFYLAVAPSLFEPIVLNLHRHGMVTNHGSWQRVVIEKPFGRDLKSASYLNSVIESVFPPENVFRIDHYLGKEMLRNLMVIRFGNAVFESIWNSRYIDNIQITAAETDGVENRAGYYESSGALRDMLQSHLLQLLALVAMEPPISLDYKSVRDEKVKFLRSLLKMDDEIFRGHTIRGQYGEALLDGGRIIKAYRQEAGIDPASNTETFIALRILAGNFRWGGMPFYLRTGKRLPKKTTYVVLEFKSMPEILYFKEYKGMQPNLLVVRIQPEEGVSFSFNAKKPGQEFEITTVKMDYCQNCDYENNSPESYERLLADALRNDQTLFASWEEIEASWSFVDSIARSWEKETVSFPNYAPGTWGPPASDELLARYGHHWCNL